MDDLPDIDVVLISHNHYDHLDLRTLRQLAARGRSTFVVAARGARLLRSEKVEPVHELDWGESVTLSGFTVHCVPALRFSARGIFDRNKTQWCGYAIEYPERLVYFAGDTAFGSHFCANSGQGRLTRACIVTNRSVRTALVHVACAYGSRGGRSSSRNSRSQNQHRHPPWNLSAGG